MGQASGRLSLPMVGRALALVLGVQPLLSAAYVAATVAESLLPVAQVWLMRELVDALSAAPGGPGGHSALRLAVLYASTLLLPALLWPLRAALIGTLMDRTTAAVDRLLLEAGARLPDLGQIERPEFADALRRAQYAAWRAAQVFQGIQWAVGGGITLVGLLLLLGGLNPWLPVALALASAPRLVGEQRLNRLRWQVLSERARPAREMDYCTELATEPGAAKEVRVFGLGDLVLDRFIAARRAALAQVGRLRLAELRRFGLFGALHALTLAGGLWYVGARVAAGSLTLGDVALYVGAVAQTEQRLLAMANWVGILNDTLLHLASLFHLVDAAGPTIALPPTGQGVEAPAAPREGLALRGVTFRYAPDAAPVLRNLDARLPAGRVTALVGANGAGKSTLVKLLTRMADPTAGEILLDGRPLAAYDLASLRRRVAVVYQDFARFALTLGENIAVGAGGEAVADEAVGEAAAWAGADDLATKLPAGYATPLTRRFEGGVELSGGEWQKVALARAAIRDAGVVILDEPTAALDADAEERLFARFRALVRGKTALLISHRLAAVRMADQILVLEDGRIVEAGSHAELLARGGRYAALYALQARQYRAEATGAGSDLSRRGPRCTAPSAGRAGA